MSLHALTVPVHESLLSRPLPLRSREVDVVQSTADRSAGHQLELLGAAYR